MSCSLPRLLFASWALLGCLHVSAQESSTESNRNTEPSWGAYEVIKDYDSYIAGSDEVTVWYGRRTALVIDDEPAPENRNAQTMRQIMLAMDSIFDAYDQVTGRRPKLTAPLRGKIRIEVSSKVGGGLAHHGRLGVAIGDGFFKGLYKRFDNGERTVDQVFFYEIARNYWMADMNPTIDYHTSKGPNDYGWWTVGFNNAMSIFLPAEIEQISDMYYFGSSGRQFSNGMEANIKTYIQNPDKFDWNNSWNVPLVPWKERTSVNDLMTGLLIRLHRDHGGIAFIKRLYAEIPKRKPLSSRSDRQGARDNFYEACSLAAQRDLYDFFVGDLRWKISDSHRKATVEALRQAGQESSDDESKGVWGNWALVMPDGSAGWLTLSQSNGTPKGELWNVGSSKRLLNVTVEGNAIQFERQCAVGDPEYDGGPPSGGRELCRHVAVVTNDAIELVIDRPLVDGQVQKQEFHGTRLPPIPPKPDLTNVKFGEPIELFNGRNLDRWRLTNPKQINGWRAVNGELVNTTPKLDFQPYSRYGNLRTDRQFTAFKLNIEFKVPSAGNSGIYLRGMYEAQVVDRDSRMQGIQGVGAIFGRIPPTHNAGKKGGEWQTYDITLVDRHVTVILNDQKVIDNEPIAGCTNGALHADESKPGPLYLQGDHTAVSYRNIVLRPVLQD